MSSMFNSEHRSVYPPYYFGKVGKTHDGGLCAYHFGEMLADTLETLQREFGVAIPEHVMRVVRTMRALDRFEAGKSEWEDVAQEAASWLPEDKINIADLPDILLEPPDEIWGPYHVVWNGSKVSLKFAPEWDTLYAVAGEGDAARGLLEHLLPEPAEVISVMNPEEHYKLLDERERAAEEFVSRWRGSKVE